MYDEAVALLAALSAPHGIHASRDATANYRAVFARDAVIAGIAGLLAGSDAVAAGLARTLERLRALQGPRGQIASNYEPRDGEATPRVSFGTLAPRLDSATWYLVGIAAAARAGVVDPGPFHASARAVVALLEGIEYNGRGLLYVPAGGNWADEYVYDGYILYDQVLRAWALRLLGDVYAEPAWRGESARVVAAIEAGFWREDGAERGRPVASFSPLGARDVFDCAACALLAVSGVAPARADATLDWIARRFLDAGALPPAFDPVIDEGHPDWPALRRYHLHGFRNRPHEYHNGGVWPVWLGWLALAYARAGRVADAARLRDGLRERVARAGGWRFEEYLHGVTGAPGGTGQMAYSAAGVVLLHRAEWGAARALLD